MSSSTRKIFLIITAGYMSIQVAHQQAVGLSRAYDGALQNTNSLNEPNHLSVQRTHKRYINGIAEDFSILINQASFIGIPVF